MAPPSAKVQAAFKAMNGFGIVDAPKIKRVLKKLLKVYDKNWKMIEDENYRVLLNAIFDDGVGNDEIPDDTVVHASPPQKRNAVEDEAGDVQVSEPPLKRRRGQSASGAEPSSTSAGLSALQEPKPEPIDEAQGGSKPKRSDVALRKKKGKQPISTESLPSASQAELPTPSKNMSRVDIEIAASSSGEVKISLSCDSLLQRPNFHVPRLDEVLKYTEEKCLGSYKTMDPSFSVTKLMKDVCECFLELAAKSTSASPEKLLNHEPAADISNKSTLLGGMNGDCEASHNMLSSSPVKSAVANCSDNVAQPSEDCVTNGIHLDEPSGDQDANGIISAVCQSLMVVEQEQHNTCDDGRLVYDAQDITRGEENFKISLLIESNSGPLPSFYYMPQNVVYCDAHVKFSLSRMGDKECCTACNGDCLSSSSSCKCFRPSRGGFTYTSEGLVKEEFLNEYMAMIRNPQKHHLAHCSVCPLEKCKNESSSEPCKGHLDRKFIKECWIRCGCSKSCVNRVVQRGISRKLQAFWTPEGKGWGLRTLDELPKGAFVCEYVGEVLTISELYQRSAQKNDNEKHSYAVILDADWSSKSLKDDQKLCLDSTSYGNIGRFINHRCSDANLVEIPIQVETSDRHYYHVALFTTRKVDANEELTWDYGIDFDDEDSYFKTFRCLCGSTSCRDMKRSNGSRVTSNAR